LKIRHVEVAEPTSMKRSMSEETISSKCQVDDGMSERESKSVELFVSARDLAHS
jgi:hypothetical protein